MSEAMRIVPSGGILGARIEDCDLKRPLAEDAVRAIRAALGAHGVLCFARQSLSPEELAAFGARFGALEINVASTTYQVPGHPEVMILSNAIEDGRPIGLGDAGQGWHTDLSYSREIALATVLHAIEVPVRDGRALGNTEFRDMRAAYDELDPAVKARIEGKTAIHDFAKFWDMMRARPGSRRAPLSAAQQARKPPVAQPLVRIHPITGRRVLYCNPGYAVRIEGMDRAESDALLALLFRHQEQAKYLWAHRWTEGDVLMWDDIATTHNAVADYGPHETRLMYRVQVMA
jgi:taurine dioxygenase